MHMRDNQICAIYNKFKKDGMFDEKPSKPGDEYYQYTIFDYI